jgi:uncharacterized phage protein gp47/JayE
VPFTRPLLSDLVTRIRSDLRGRLSVLGPLLRRAMADVLSSVWAGGIHDLYGYLDWAVRQLFASSADEKYLLIMAAAYGMSPTPATFASGTVTFTGTNGTVITTSPTVTLRLNEAITYHLTVGGTIASGTATGTIVSDIAGADANIPIGTTLQLESPIAGVSSTVTVAASITNGIDQEDVEEFRARFLLRLRKPPAGGRTADYEGWAEAVAGVTRAFVYPLEKGLGTVVVRFVNDNDSPIFPDAGEVAAVQAYLDSQRPVTANVTVIAPTQLSVAFTIHLVPDTSDTRAAVNAQLVDLFVREAEPGDGVSRGKILLSQIRTAIGVAAGVEDYTLTVPSADVTPALGQLPTVGTITWA